MLDKVTDAIVKVVSQIPSSKEKVVEANLDDRIAQMIGSASWKAAATAGSLALPVGPLGLLTILPDLYVTWKIQAQLVADIAAVHGRSEDLRSEEMLYCLFGDGDGQVLKNVASQAGKRIFKRRYRAGALRSLAESIALRLGRRIFGETVSRFIPLIGAVAVGRFVKRDTERVGEAAREIFGTTLKEANLH